MVKRELVDRKALIDNGLSKGFCEWYDEIKQAEVITEQDIVKPYLEKLKEQVSHCNLCLLVNKEDVLGFIDNLLSESEE